MSKGKRKSNPQALEAVRQRLQCRHTAVFTEADRELLMQLCRLDLIHILEVDLALGPLKSSQKNSVACMVSFLLSQQQQQDVQPVLDAGAALGRAGSSPVPEVQRNSRWSPPAAAADLSLLFPGADGQGRSPSSGGGSCPTPNEQQLQQLLRPHTPASDAMGAAAPAADPANQPWLAELHEQLEAAGTMRYRLGDDATDTDDDTNGTGATSSWVGEDLDDQQHVAAGGSQALGAPLDTSNIEEMLVQQLLLDMNAVPRHRAHRDRSFNSRLEQRGEQQQQQQQEEEAQHAPPPLLQQKLQQLDEQQRLLQEQQRMQQERQQQDLMRQQQQQLQREMRQQAEFDQMLQDELLHQLQAREAPQLMQQQLGNSSSLAAQQTATTAVGAAIAQLSPIAAAPAGFCGLQQPRQITTWPLPGLAPAELDSSATAAAAAAAGGLLGAPGLPFHRPRDASLPLPTPAWRSGRASADGGSGSFTRKREKVLMDLPTLQDEAPTGSGDDPELSVEPSGPSAELPTKRRSITLPGCGEVASLPTSFSGQEAGPAGVQRPQLTDLQQLMQLSSCDDPADMSWQVPQQMQYQQQYQQQQLPGTQVGLPQSGSGMSGITSKLKTLLRGHKLKAKARRCNTVGAGGSFSAAAGADTKRIPSADAALALQAAAAAAAAGGGYPDQLYPQQLAGQQHGVSYGPGVYAAQSSGLYMQVGLAPQAQDRQWHSSGLPAVGRNPSDCSLGPPTVGGFSWHASGSTMLPPGLAGVPQQGDGQHMFSPASTAPGGVAASSSQFAQQLAQLRAEYGQQQETCGPLYPMQGSGHIPMPPAGPGTSVPVGLGLECYAGAVADMPERLVTTGYSGARSGIVGKLVRALKMGSNPAQACSVLGPTGPNLGGMEVCEEHEELLIMGRTDGEMDLARAALQWPESRALNPREEVLQALGLQVQGESRAGAGAGGEGPSIGMQ